MSHSEIMILCSVTLKKPSESYISNLIDELWFSLWPSYLESLKKTQTPEHRIKIFGNRNRNVFILIRWSILWFIILKNCSTYVLSSFFLGFASSYQVEWRCNRSYGIKLFWKTIRIFTFSSICDYLNDAKVHLS